MPKTVSSRFTTFLALASVVVVMAAGSPASAGWHGKRTGPSVLVQAEPAAFSDCPSNWVCLWEHANYSGTMVLFRDCCAWYNLADVVFNNVMSSWRNRKNVDAKVAELADGNGAKLCLNASSSDPSLGGNWNDVASSVKVFASPTAC